MAEGRRALPEPVSRSVPIAMTVACDFAPGYAVGAERRESLGVFLPATVFAIEAATTRLFSDAARVRLALQRRLLEPRGERRESAGQPRDVDVLEALWEIADDSGLHSAFVVLPVDQPVRDALATGSSGRGFLIAYRATRRGPLPHVELYCQKITFEAGSLTTYLENLARGTGFALTLLVATMGTQPLVDAYERYRMTQEITAVYGGEPFVTSTTVGIDASTLLDAAAHDMHFAVAGLEPRERARRVALVQLALDLNGYPVGGIDGIYGNDTQTQLHAFAVSKRITDDINDPNLRRALVRALHAGAWELVKN